MLAVVQTLAYFGLLGYDYWIGARDEKLANVREYVRRDFGRPLFEPSGWCGAYTRYGFGQSAVLGIDLPAHVSASLLLSLVIWQPSCAESLITPRGQLITAAFVPALWLLLGTSIRRLAQRRWHKHVVGRLRLVPALGLIALPVALVCIVFSVIMVFASAFSLSVRLAGFAFWMFYIATLAAERLRVWPFISPSAAAN
jgi:hypothetical protein